LQAHKAFQAAQQQASCQSAAEDDDVDGSIVTRRHDTPPSNTKSRMQTPTMRRIVAMMNRLRVRTSGRQAIKNKRLKSIHYLLAIAIFCLLSRFFATNRDSCYRDIQKIKNRDSTNRAVSIFENRDSTNRD